MDVSVVIVNYNTKELTRKCVDSVFMQTKGITFEVILVDNGSNDGSPEYFENDNRILLVKSDVNLGFGKANNLGCQYATGKYLFLLNSDTILLNNAIYEFFTQMESRSADIACMGCFLSNANNRRSHSYGSFPTIRNELIRRPFSFLWGCRFFKKGFDDMILRVVDSHCFEVEYVTGADLFIRKSVIDRLGLFDPSFFMYYEDAEMQYRYRKNGYISVIVDKPQIMHFGGGSHKALRDIQWRSYDIASCINCYRKNYGLLRTYIFKMVMLIAYLPFALCCFHHPVHQRFSVLRKFASL